MQQKVIQGSSKVFWLWYTGVGFIYLHLHLHQILPFVVYILGAVLNQAQCLTLVKSSSTPDACPFVNPPILSPPVLSPAGSYRLVKMIEKEFIISR